MIEIYKTNIIKIDQAKKVYNQLKKSFPSYKIDFDLEDCDRILRIDTIDKELNQDAILKIVTDCGFYIEVLADEIPFLKV
ncbi:hypothetical protein [Flavobacterium sp. NG2]|uniref:hypothetical protein n=1 Tax=Flavobacterium sp. NG2 TaxID=3097547 RepID=UPI0039C11B20